MIVFPAMDYEHYKYTIMYKYGRRALDFCGVSVFIVV